MRFNPEFIEIVPIIERLISSHKEGLNEKSISVSIKAETPSITAYIDIDRMTQVFINLLANTLKYTDSQGELSIMINQVSDKILIRWMDSEPGVKAEDLVHLFTRLYRADPSRNRKNGGAGLGLSLSRAIIVNSGGTMTAMPSPLGGIQIDITLPASGNGIA